MPIIRCLSAIAFRGHLPGYQVKLEAHVYAGNAGYYSTISVMEARLDDENQRA